MKNVVGEEVIGLWSQASGVDVEAEKIDLHGPLARAPRREDLIVAAAVLYLSGQRWGEAKRLADQIYSAADKIQAEIFGAALFPGVEDALRKLRDAGFKLAIATNAPHVSAEDMLRAIGVEELFDAIVGADEVENQKPAPDMVLLASERSGCTPAETVFVGDMPMDMNAERRASVKAVIAMRSGLVMAEEIEDLADVVIDSVAEIKLLLHI